jgi:ribosomal protein S18 acetylase RimI-like enzyme
MILHRPGAPGLRLGLGPGLEPCDSMVQLQHLFDHETFWARGRSLKELRRMLRGSEAAVTAWRGRQLVGFGRATSDGVCRAVLWDVVVSEECKLQGLGRQLVARLLEAPLVVGAERVYLMTTNSKGFYTRLGFQESGSQHLMLRRGSG